MSSAPTSLAGPPVAPWWHFRIVWLVAALPALAVAGSLLSAAIAVRHADPVVTERLPAAEDAGIAARRANPLEPALQARNHASLKRP
jgi:hypothetical protein